MSITFESVSYSYSAPSNKKKLAKITRKAEKAEALRNKNLSSKDVVKKPDWGNMPDAVWAIRDINFTLKDGEFFGIAGHTGSGKSTLIQHMNGLAHPTFGRVLVDGKDIADKKIASELRTKVGLVFQYPEHQLFAATVYDDVAFGPRNMGKSPEEVDTQVKKALQQVAIDFDAVRDKSPFELSGGQQRRIAFAGVLAMEPSILILDEPVAGLDPAARTDFLELISQLHRSGLTVAMVSHSMNNLARYCDRILVLKEGEQFALGSPEEVFAQAEELKAIGLGVPSPQHMALSLQAKGIALSGGLYDLENLADELATLYNTKQDGTIENSFSTAAFSVPSSEKELPYNEQMFHVKHSDNSKVTSEVNDTGVDDRA